MAKIKISHLLREIVIILLKRNNNSCQIALVSGVVVAYMTHEWSRKILIIPKSLTLSVFKWIQTFLKLFRSKKCSMQRSITGFRFVQLVVPEFTDPIVGKQVEFGLF